MTTELKTSRSRRFRFRLRTLLVLTAIVSALFFVWTRYIKQPVMRRIAVHRIFNTGGELTFDTPEVPNDMAIGEPGDAAFYNLNSVHARDNLATFEVARQLQSIPEVTELMLGDQVTDAGLSAIAHVRTHPSLNSLFLFDSQVTTGGMSQLTDVEWLRDIYLVRSAIDHRAIEGLGSIQALRHLWIIDNNTAFGAKGSTNANLITEPIAKQLAKLQRIEFISFQNVNLSDASARHLHSLQNLRFLGLNDCRISDEAVAELRAALPECKVEVASNWATDEPSLDETDETE